MARSAKPASNMIPKPGSHIETLKAIASAVGGAHAARIATVAASLTDDAMLAAIIPNLRDHTSGTLNITGATTWGQMNVPDNFGKEDLFGGLLAALQAAGFTFKTGFNSRILDSTKNVSDIRDAFKAELA